MNVLRNSALLSVGLLLGRGIGYVRELLIAHNHGVSKDSDLIILALTVPEFVSNILSTGLATNIVVPRLHAITEQRMTSFLNDSWKKLLLLSAYGFILFSLFSVFYFSWNVAVILIFSSLSLFPNAMTALTSAYLTYKEKFRSQALSNLVFNVFATLGIFFFTNIYLITAAFILASVFRFLLTRSEASDDHFKDSIWTFIRKKSDHENDLSIRAFLLSALSSGLIILNPLIARLFAVKLGDGAVSTITYAEKLYILPLTLLISPFLTASYSKMSKDLSSDPGAVLRKFKKPLAMIALACALIVICSWFISDLIVRLTFGISGLNSDEQKAIAVTFSAFIPGLVFSGCSLFLNNVFFALKQERMIAVTSITAVVINLLGDILVWKFYPEVWALAAVTTFTSFVIVLYQLAKLRSISRKVQNG